MSCWNKMFDTVSWLWCSVQRPVNSADTLVVLSHVTRWTLHCRSGKGLIWPARVLVKFLSQDVDAMVTINLLVHTHKKLIRSEVLDFFQDYKFNVVGHRNLNMITSFDSQRIVKQCDPKFLDMKIVILNIVLRTFCDNQLQILLEHWV